MSLQSPNPQQWSKPASILPLRDHALHIWRIDLPIAPSFLSICQSILTAEETARADRRKHPESRQHAILGRGALRLLLAHNTNQHPAAVPITKTANGKPQTQGLAFNVSHSANILLIALQRRGSIGIDVERINPDTPIMGIAARSFTATETASLVTISNEAARRAAFFQLWTRKESLVKADGRGLLLPTNSFETHDIITTTTTSFRLHNLHVGDSYAAALATNQHSLTPQLFHFPTP
jgi:4'-phosphopantetheinyl transferase